ncbi:MAG: hypothetical protein WKF48_12135, partial [Solirubrobacteraceae bacterium]
MLREVDAGDAVQITVRGRVVAEMHPPRRRQLTPTAVAVRLLAQPADSTWSAELLVARDAAEADEPDLGRSCLDPALDDVDSLAARTILSSWP